LKNDTGTGRRLTMQEVAELLNKPIETLKNWRWRGFGPESYNLGRRVFYDEDAVLAWIEEQRQASSQKRDDVEHERRAAWIKKQLENAPPLTPDQQELIRRLFGRRSLAPPQVKEPAY
jgi:Helix-turn-helix domain